jgi:hypothetical protein
MPENPRSKSEALRASAERLIKESKRLREVAEKVQHEADLLAEKKKGKKEK